MLAALARRIKNPVGRMLVIGFAFYPLMGLVGTLRDLIDDLVGAPMQVS